VLCKGVAQGRWPNG